MIPARALHAIHAQIHAADADLAQAAETSVGSPAHTLAIFAGFVAVTLYLVLTAGQFDILVELLCADRRSLLDLTNRIRSLDGVLSTETFLYLELWKQLYDWGARVQDGTRMAKLG